MATHDQFIKSAINRFWPSFEYKQEEFNNPTSEFMIRFLKTFLQSMNEIILSSVNRLKPDDLQTIYNPEEMTINQIYSRCNKIYRDMQMDKVMDPFRLGDIYCPTESSIDKLKCFMNFIVHVSADQSDCAEIFDEVKSVSTQVKGDEEKRSLLLNKIKDIKIKSCQRTSKIDGMMSEEKMKEIYQSKLNDRELIPIQTKLKAELHERNNNYRQIEANIIALTDQVKILESKVTNNVEVKTKEIKLKTARAKLERLCEDNERLLSNRENNRQLTDHFKSLITVIEGFKDTIETAKENITKIKELKVKELENTGVNCIDKCEIEIAELKEHISEVQLLLKSHRSNKVVVLEEKIRSISDQKKKNNNLIVELDNITLKLKKIMNDLENLNKIIEELDREILNIDLEAKENIKRIDSIVKLSNCL